VPLIAVKGALTGLHEMRLVRVERGRLALGVALGAWSDAAWSQLRAQLLGAAR
jgi:hypothetical protein